VKSLRSWTLLQDLRTAKCATLEGTLGISVNMAGNVPSWKGDANLPLAAGRAAEAATLAVAESLLTGLETASGVEPTRAPDAGRASGHGHLSAQAQEPGLPVLAALPVAVPAIHGKDSLGMPEDWFEPSAPARITSGPGIIEPADRAQSIPANPQVSARLEATRMVEGPYAGAIDSGQQTRSNQVGFETVQVQSLAAGAALGAVLAKGPPEVYRLQGTGIRRGDELMEEIPLLFAPVHAEPQPPASRMRFKGVVVNGLLMLGAVLVATLSLNDLPGIEMMEVAAAVLAILGVLCLIFRWARPGRP
jgi:hypothetical protein